MTASSRSSTFAARRGAASSFLLTLAFGLLGSPALARAPQATEKELIAAFEKAFADSDLAKRADAVRALGEATRSLPDKGVGKRVAMALVLGLEDDEPEVRQEALGQLCYGRHVDVTITGLRTFLEGERARIERGLGKDDAASRDLVSRGVTLFENGCYALATYPDDRSAATLVALVRGFPKPKENDFVARAAPTVAWATLALGTLDAVDAVVKLVKSLDGPVGEPVASEVHAALLEFATRTGRTAQAPSEWSEKAPEAWRAWLEASGEQLPKKLGRAATPPMNGPVHGMNGLPGKNG